MILKASLRDWSTRYANSNWIKEFISVDLEILTQELQPFPTLLPLPDLPLIDFNKFSTTITRNRNSNPKKAKDVQDLKPTNDTQNNANSENNLHQTSDDTNCKISDNSNNNNHNNNNNNNSSTNKPKSPSFNQLWTGEELEKLQELLKIYPDEPVALNRYRKIAKALGNRTPKQIACKIQKMNDKLKKKSQRELKEKNGTPHLILKKEWKAADAPVVKKEFIMSIDEEDDDNLDQMEVQKNVISPLDLRKEGEQSRETNEYDLPYNFDINYLDPNYQ